MEWKSVEEGKPKADCMCLGYCDKGFMGIVLCLYTPSYDVFREYDPDSRKSFCLDISHYIEIPETPPFAARRED